METLITRSISISVKSDFWAPYSQPERDHYVYAYRITIENQGREPVQLLSRYWKVSDSQGASRVVEGTGVAGDTPFILPGERYTYTSWCQLRTGLGAMEGHYNMCLANSKEHFPVFVPRFTLQAPWLLN